MPNLFGSTFTLFSTVFICIRIGAFSSFSFFSPRNMNCYCYRKKDNKYVIDNKCIKEKKYDSNNWSYRYDSVYHNN